MKHRTGPSNSKNFFSRSNKNKSTSITYNTFSFVKFPIDPVAMFDIRLRLSNLKEQKKWKLFAKEISLYDEGKKWLKDSQFQETRDKHFA